MRKLKSTQSVTQMQLEAVWQKAVCQRIHPTPLVSFADSFVQVNTSTQEASLRLLTCLGYGYYSCITVEGVNICQSGKESSVYLLLSPTRCWPEQLLRISFKWGRPACCTHSGAKICYLSACAGMFHFLRNANWDLIRGRPAQAPWLYNLSGPTR